MPLTPADLSAAVLALGYVPTPDRTSIMADLPAINATQANALGSLADSLIRRFGVDDISPAALAYYDEVCRTYGPWPTTAEVPEDSVIGILQRLHSPCQEIADAGPDTQTQAAGPAPGVRTCLAYSDADSITPPDFARSWLLALGQNTVVVQESAASHADVEMTKSCYELLTAAVR